MKYDTLELFIDDRFSWNEKTSILLSNPEQFEFNHSRLIQVIGIAALIIKTLKETELKHYTS